MSDNEPYVDPNSGAAPQPGGYAGPDLFEAGHGSRMPVESEIPDQSGEDHGDDEAEELADAERVEKQTLITQGIAPSAEEEPDEYEGFPEGEGELDQDSEGEAVDHQSDQQGVVTPAQAPGAIEDDILPSEASKEAGLGEDTGSDDDADDDSDESSDYSELLDSTVPDVVAYMDEHPDERDAVVQAERDRAAAAEKEPRKGITGDE